MKVGNVVAYIALTGIAVLSVWMAARLCRRYPHPALRFYLIALAGFFGDAILGVIGNYIIQEMLFNQSLPATAHATAAWVFQLLSFPFYITAIYAFLAMLMAWAEVRFSPAWRISFFLLQALLIAVFLVAGPHAIFQTPSATRSAPLFLFRLVGALNVLILVSAALIFAFYYSKKPALPLPRGISFFALLYAVLFAGGFAILNMISPGKSHRIAEPAIAFLSHPLPLLVLWRALERHFRSHPLVPVDADRAAAILARYRISEREAEIVRLLLQGKSYRDIEEELFISLKTVKAHVYNIYRKMGVKSRWQLLNRLQSPADSRSVIAGIS